MEKREILKKNGFLVKPRIGRCALYIWFDHKKLIKDSDTNEVLSKYGEKSKLYFVPKEIEKQLSSISISLRQQIKDLSLGEFFPKDRLDKAYKIFDEKKDEYFEVLKKIENGYDFYINNFKKDISLIKDKEIVNEILNTIPSLEDIVNSFYMELEVYPILISFDEDMEVEDYIKQEIQKGLDKKVELYISEIYGSLLNNLFISIKNGINKTMEIGYTHGKILNKIKKEIKEMDNNNYFNNALMHEFVKKYENFDKEEVTLEVLETLYVDTYHLAKNLRVSYFLDFKDSPLTKEEVELMI